MQESIRMLEAQDIKEILGIALGSVYKLMKRTDFPAIWVSSRRVVIPEHAFIKWLDKQVEEKNKEINTCLRCGCKFKAEHPSITKYCKECGMLIRAQQNRARVQMCRERKKHGADC